MLKAKSFLAIDCGASSLKLAEFNLNEAGGLRLRRYSIKNLGLEGAQEATRQQAMVKALQTAFSETSFSSRAANICAPGFHVFSKFVKLPPVEVGSAKVSQMVEWEAKQNVPFPLEEVVWDYQILGTTAAGELEVLLIAIKTDVVEGLYRTAESAGLKINVVDVTPAALINAFRFNYSDLAGCTMLLDIGAKTSNLLFLEKGKVFARSINIGANMITQEFANEYKLKFDEAERIKIEKGFVSLGGAYEEPDDPQAAAISKIARQVMTRLHIQMNQTINFYRQSQGGSAPERVFLSGGASIMAYLPQFLAEKLNLPVDYFNPLRNIQIDPEVNLEELAKVAHTMGEVVGLGLRNLAHCPVELNLVPISSQKVQEFNQKKPYLLAALFSLALVVFAVGLLKDKIVEVKRQELEKLVGIISPLSATDATIMVQERKLKETRIDAEQVRAWLEGRYYWADLLPVLRECLMATEFHSKTNLTADVGIWIEKMKAGMSMDEKPQGYFDTSMLTRPQMNLSAAGTVVATPATTSQSTLQSNAITHVTVRVRAVDMTPVNPAGNTTVAFELMKMLQERPAWFDTNGTNPTAFIGTITTETNTFWTDILLKLKRPITF